MASHNVEDEERQLETVTARCSRFRNTRFGTIKNVLNGVLGQRFNDELSASFIEHGYELNKVTGVTSFEFELPEAGQKILLENPDAWKIGNVKVTIVCINLCLKHS